MKNMSKYFFAIFMILVFACKKDENRVYLEGSTAPVLTASRTGTIPLTFLNKDQEAIKLTWTNPSYIFTTGVSSHNVNYQIEIDTTGSNFTNPSRKIISITNDLSLTMTQEVLNDYLLNQLQLAPGMPHPVEMRVRATLGSGGVPLFSNVLQYTITPYAIPPKVAPPASGRLFIVGSATPGAWSNPVPLPNQEFTKISPTMYEITIPLTGGGSYLLLPVNGSWDAKYGGLGANNTNNPNEDDFKAQGGDLLAPAASGNYKIRVDFQRGKFTVTKL